MINIARKNLGKKSGLSEHWLRSAQIVVTIGFMILLLNRIEWTALYSLFIDLRWELVTLSIGLLIISHLMNVIRWEYMLLNLTVGRMTLLAFYGAGLLSNSFLPTGMGGDGVRAALLSQRVSPRWAILSVALDRSTGLVALSALLTIGLWTGPPPGLIFVSDELFTRLAPCVTVLFVLVLGIATVSLAIGWRKANSLLVKLQHRVYDLIENWSVKFSTGDWLRLFTGGYILSVISHMCIVMANWVMLQAIGIQVPVSAALWLVLAITLSLLFPIAINGLGVREATYVMLLTIYGVAHEPAVMAALLSRFTLTFFGFAGGIIWLLASRSPDLLMASESH